MILRQAIQRDLAVAQDQAQHIVEVMRDTAGQRADGFHFLGVPQLPLEAYLGRDVVLDRHIVDDLTYYANQNVTEVGPLKEAIDKWMEQKSASYAKDFKKLEQEGAFLADAQAAVQIHTPINKEYLEDLAVVVLASQSADWVEAERSEDLDFPNELYKAFIRSQTDIVDNTKELIRKYGIDVTKFAPIEELKKFELEFAKAFDPLTLAELYSYNEKAAGHAVMQSMGLGVTLFDDIEVAEYVGQYSKNTKMPHTLEHISDAKAEEFVLEVAKNMGIMATEDQTQVKAAPAKSAHSSKAQMKESFAELLKTIPRKTSLSQL